MSYSDFERTGYLLQKDLYNETYHHKGIKKVVARSPFYNSYSVFYQRYEYYGASEIWEYNNGWLMKSTYCIFDSARNELMKLVTDYIYADSNAITVRSSLYDKKWWVDTPQNTTTYYYHPVTGLIDSVRVFIKKPKLNYQPADKADICYTLAHKNGKEYISILKTNYGQASVTTGTLYFHYRDTTAPENEYLELLQYSQTPQYIRDKFKLPHNWHFAKERVSNWNIAEMQYCSLQHKKDYEYATHQWRHKRHVYNEISFASGDRSKSAQKQVFHYKHNRLKHYYSYRDDLQPSRGSAYNLFNAKLSPRLFGKQRIRARYYCTYVDLIEVPIRYSMNYTITRRNQLLRKIKIGKAKVTVSYYK
jgi:hypothetical protein